MTVHIPPRAERIRVYLLGSVVVIFVLWGLGIWYPSNETLWDFVVAAAILGGLPGVLAWAIFARKGYRLLSARSLPSTGREPPMVTACFELLQQPGMPPGAILDRGLECSPRAAGDGTVVCVRPEAGIGLRAGVLLHCAASGLALCVLAFGSYAQVFLIPVLFCFMIVSIGNLARRRSWPVITFNSYGCALGSGGLAPEFVRIMAAAPRRTGLRLTLSNGVEEDVDFPEGSLRPETLQAIVLDLFRARGVGPTAHKSSNPSSGD